MIIFYFIVIFLGILAGTFTGLIPGIHINLVSIILLSTTTLTIINPLFLVIFIVAMAITHTFLDFIPSIYLGAPDEDTGLSVLPGHKFLLQGHAHEAVMLTLYGSITAMPIILIFTPIFIFLLPIVQQPLQNIMFLIIIFTSIFLILTERKNKLIALIIFILAGFLGIITYNIPINQPLFPLLTGLFGGSSLVTSIIKKQKIPKQTTQTTKKNFSLKIILASMLSAPLCSFLPSLGSAQAAVIGSSIVSTNKKSFLTLLGAINTIVMALSFITLYVIGKTRTGAALAISQLITLTPTYIYLIILTIIISAIISIPLTIFFSKFFAKHINKINYSILSYLILSFLIILILCFSSLFGTLIFLVSTALGLFCISLNIRRTHLMGALMIPTILFYFPF